MGGAGGWEGGTTEREGLPHASPRTSACFAPSVRMLRPERPHASPRASSRPVAISCTVRVPFSSVLSLSFSALSLYLSRAHAASRAVDVNPSAPPKMRTDLLSRSLLPPPLSFLTRITRAPRRRRRTRVAVRWSSCGNASSSSKYSSAYACTDIFFAFFLSEISRGAAHSTRTLTPEHVPPSPRRSGHACALRRRCNARNLFNNLLRLLWGEA